jgi:hypothetical protein
MFEVKSRSEEAWGPLAKCDDKTFEKLINGRDAKDAIKNHIKKQKKLKTYKVTFKKVWNSASFEIQAESDYHVQTVAKQYFKQNEESIGFKEQARNQWADGYAGYDSLSYVKVR